MQTIIGWQEHLIYIRHLYLEAFSCDSRLCTVDSTCQMHTGEKTIYIPDVIVVDQHNLVVLTKYLMFGISHSVITSESIMLVH